MTTVDYESLGRFLQAAQAVGAVVTTMHVNPSMTPANRFKVQAFAAKHGLRVLWSRKIPGPMMFYFSDGEARAGERTDTAGEVR
jgi:hypothetical protein